MYRVFAYYPFVSRCRKQTDKRKCMLRTPKKSTFWNYCTSTCFVFTGRLWMWQLKSRDNFSEVILWDFYMFPFVQHAWIVCKTPVFIFFQNRMRCTSSIQRSLTSAQEHFADSVGVLIYVLCNIISKVTPILLSAVYKWHVAHKSSLLLQINETVWYIVIGSMYDSAQLQWPLLLHSSKHAHTHIHTQG